MKTLARGFQLRQRANHEVSKLLILIPVDSSREHLEEPVFGYDCYPTVAWATSNWEVSCINLLANDTWRWIEEMPREFWHMLWNIQVKTYIQVSLHKSERQTISTCVIYYYVHCPTEVDRYGVEQSHTYDEVKRGLQKLSYLPWASSH